MVIRKAERKDLPSLLAIYNNEVEHGTSTFDVEPKTMKQWEVWFSQHNIENHPLIVAEVEGVVVGYASLSCYRDMAAYRSTAELSVYIDPAYRRRGIATDLMERILAMAREDSGLHVVVSVITDSNAASITLHEQFGFTFCGGMREVGIKFGKYLGIVHFELIV